MDKPRSMNFTLHNHISLLSLIYFYLFLRDSNDQNQCSSYVFSMIKSSYSLTNTPHITQKQKLNLAPQKCDIFVSHFNPIKIKIKILFIIWNINTYSQEQTVRSVMGYFVIVMTVATACHVSRKIKPKHLIRLPIYRNAMVRRPYYHSHYMQIQNAISCKCNRHQGTTPTLVLLFLNHYETGRNMVMHNVSQFSAYMKLVCLWRSNTGLNDDTLYFSGRWF